MWLPFIAGFVNKLYDDLVDNKCLKPYKNKFVMELLKGLHYITLTAVSLQNPLFFILFCSWCLINCLGDLHCWENSYEKSLFFSFLVLFLLIDYKKVKELNIVDYIVMVIIFVTGFIEPLFIRCEVSLLKLIIRLAFVFTSTFIIFRC